ncbi:hypothetical protein YC2023_038784 [Brassica napus]
MNSWQRYDVHVPPRITSKFEDLRLSRSDKNFKISNPQLGWRCFTVCMWTRSSDLSFSWELEKMEISVALVVVSVAIVVVSWWTWRALMWIWFKPKMLESYLRRQGLSGTPYTPLVGDLKKNFTMTMEARSKPIHYKKTAIF